MLCPECGTEVPEGQEEGHAEDHWPEDHLRAMEKNGDPRHFAEARRRKNILLGKEDAG